MTLGYKSFRRLYAWGCLALALTVIGCERKDSPQATAGHSRVISTWTPLRWRDDSSLLALRIQRRTSGDAGQVECEASGLYEARLTGAIRPLVVGARICERLWDATAISIAPDESALAYLSKGGVEGAGLRILALARSDSSTAIAGCSGTEGSIAWSDDARMIAVSNACTAGPGVTILSRTGTPMERIPVTDVVESLRWAPHGKQLAAVRASDSSKPMVVVFSRATQADESFGPGVAPSWGQSGNDLLFLPIDSAGRVLGNLARVALGTGAVRLEHRLPARFAGVLGPDWQYATTLLVSDTLRLAAVAPRAGLWITEFGEQGRTVLIP